MTRVSAGIDRLPILLNPEDDRSFREQGFAVVPFVSPERIAELRQLVIPLIPENSAPFFTLYKNDGPELRRQIDAFVRAEIQPVADDLLCNHRFYIGSIFVKYPGEGSAIGAHQDWTFVDESRFLSGAIWLPLQPTNAKNGGMYLQPGSHRLDLPYRGSPPDLLQPNIDEFVPCDMEIGTALVHHNALIHGSTQNNTDELRIVMALGFVSEGAQMFHFQT
ncbi:MAG: phytanoyl-CoA dioxygenase family protein, partial [Microthrixaceae bacterium]